MNPRRRSLNACPRSLFRPTLETLVRRVPKGAGTRGDTRDTRPRRNRPNVSPIRWGHMAKSRWSDVSPVGGSLIRETPTTHTDGGHNRSAAAKGTLDD